jgi:hypothetical protein
LEIERLFDLKPLEERPLEECHFKYIAVLRLTNQKLKVENYLKNNSTNIKPYKIIINKYTLQ